MIFTRAGTPPDALDRLRREMARVIDSPDVVKRLTGAGAYILKMSPPEAEQFVLAAHWADLHAPETVLDLLDDVEQIGRASVPGSERGRPAGADGAPMIAEFAAAELAALLGMSTTAGRQLIADAVNLRHRHPLLWGRLCAGDVRCWVAAA